MGSLLFIGLVFGLIIIDQIIRKRLTKGKTLADTPGKRADKFSKWVFVAFFITGLLLVQRNPSFDMMTILPFFLIVTLVWEIHLEWKYLRETKSYILSLITYPLILLVLFCNGLFF